MTHRLKLRFARRLAQKLGARARGLRRELRDHDRLEFARIHLAEKRARGLRLYAAWSCRPEPAHPHPLTRPWQATESVA